MRQIVVNRAAQPLQHRDQEGGAGDTINIIIAVDQNRLLALQRGNDPVGGFCDVG